MEAVLREIVPGGNPYHIDSRMVRSERGIPLEVAYLGRLDPSYKRVWEERTRHKYHIFNRSGVWRGREAVNWLDIDTEDPAVYAKHLVSFDGGENAEIGPIQLYNATTHAGLDNARTWYLTFRRNPTRSFKDGGMVALFTQGKHLKVRRYICASTGNTAESLAAGVANERALPPEQRYLERPVVVIPKGKVAEGKLLGARANGALIIEVDGDFDDALELSRKLIERNPNLYPANSYNPFRIEGQKTEMYPYMEMSDYEVPDWVVTPGGNLGSASAAHKSFKEMEEWGWTGRLPRLAIVVSEASPTLDILHNEIKFRWDGTTDVARLERYYAEIKRELERKPMHTDLSAIYIQAPASENYFKAQRALHEMDGVVIRVSDRDAWEAKAAIDSNGLGMVDVASAASVAGMKKLRDMGLIEPRHKVLARLTGDDKDPQKSTSQYTNPDNPFANLSAQVSSAEEAEEVLFRDAGIAA